MPNRARPRTHAELHRTDRVGWLRAAVLGANDGIVSVAGLVVGVAASGADSGAILTAGIAGTVAGAMSMAAGEYVSVQSQADTERADMAIERRELHEQPEAELRELARIYEQRGLDPALALQVAEQLTAHDALGAHARDELGITAIYEAQPIRAALASAAAFAAGAALPLAVVAVAPPPDAPLLVGTASLLCLVALGATAARFGGSPVLRSVLRVAFWGAVAMAVTFGVGRLFGVAV